MAVEGRSIQAACRILAVSESGFYARRPRPPSARAIRHVELTDLIGRVHLDSRGTYGARRVHAELLSATVSSSATARWPCSCVEPGSPASPDGRAFDASPTWPRIRPVERPFERESR